MQAQATQLTLIRETAVAVGLTLPFNTLHSLRINWCGETNTMTSAPAVASTTSGTATWKVQVIYGAITIFIRQIHYHLARGFTEKNTQS